MSAPPMTPAMAASIAHQKQHIDDSKVGMLLASVWSLWSLAAVAVGLRVYAERTMRNNWRWHDSLIVVGLIFTLGKAIINTIMAQHGFGRHIILASQPDLIIISKLYYTFNFVYSSAITAIKASILCFYHRTFPNRVFRAAVWAMSVFVALWYIANTVATTFQCMPIDKAWLKSKPGYCINMPSMLVIFGIINVLTDVAIVVMPLPLIWGLNLPAGRRYGLMGIFALSSIVIVACIARPIFLSFPRSYDYTYDGVTTNIWCIVEPSIAIVGACLPLMAPLFRKVAYFGTSFTSSFTSSLAKYSSNNSGQSFTKEKQSQDSQATMTSQSSGAWPKGIEISTAISFDVSDHLGKSHAQVTKPARTLTCPNPKWSSDMAQANRISGPTYPSLPHYLLPTHSSSDQPSSNHPRSNPSPTTAHRSLEISSPSSPSHRQEQFVDEFTLVSPPYNAASCPSSFQPDRRLRQSREVATSRQTSNQPGHERCESLKRVLSASVRKAASTTTAAADGLGNLVPTSRYSRTDSTRSGTDTVHVERTMSLTSTREESTHAVSADRTLTMPTTLLPPIRTASALPRWSGDGEPNPSVALARMEQGQQPQKESLVLLDDTDTETSREEESVGKKENRRSIKKVGESFYLHS